jgi:hypothetical protein
MPFIDVLQEMQRGNLSPQQYYKLTQRSRS